MKRFAALLRLNLKYYVIPSFDSKKSKRRYIALIALMCVAFLAPLIMICLTLWYAAQTMLAVGAGDTMLAAVFTMSQLLVLFFSVFTYMSSIFFAKDNEIMLNLPLRNAEIFSAKLLCTYINELTISAVTVIPVTVITAISGIQAGFGAYFGAGYWILIPFAVILMPVMPLLLLSIISFPIAMIVQKMSKRPVISAIVQAVLLIAFIAVAYLFSYGSSYGMEGAVDGSVNTGVFEGLGGISVYTALLAKAMLGQSAAGNFFAFFGITVAMAAAALGLSVLLYRKAVYMSVDGGSGTGRRTSAAKDGEVRGVKRALVQTQARTLLRDSGVLVNLIMTLVLPVVMVILMTLVMPSGEELVESDPSASADMLRYFDYFALGMAVMIMMFSSPVGNVGASYAFSLDKDNIQILKTMPLSGKDIFKSKLIVSDIVSLASVVLVAAALPFVTDLNWYAYILCPVFIAVYLVSCNAFTMSRDLKNPKFNWVTIKELTKASTSATQMIMMAVCLAFGLVATLPMFVLAFAGATLPDYAVEAIIWGAMGLSCVASYFILRLPSFGNAERDFALIEA